MNNQHFKAVVWPRESVVTKDLKFHRYVIVGMLITENPIPELEGKNEVLLDGQTFGLADTLATIPQREPNHRVGDATDALLNLNDL